MIGYKEYVLTGLGGNIELAVFCCSVSMACCLPGNNALFRAMVVVDEERAREIKQNSTIGAQGQKQLFSCMGATCFMIIRALIGWGRSRLHLVRSSPLRRPQGLKTSES